MALQNIHSQYDYLCLWKKKWIFFFIKVYCICVFYSDSRASSNTITFICQYTYRIFVRGALSHSNHTIFRWLSSASRCYELQRLSGWEVELSPRQLVLSSESDKHPYQLWDFNKPSLNKSKVSKFSIIYLYLDLLIVIRLSPINF